MAEPYLLVAYWNENAPEYDALIRSVIGSITAINAAVHLAFASGIKTFSEVPAAANALSKSSEPISAFEIELGGGASISTTPWGRSGRIIELDLRASEQFEAQPNAKKADPYAALQILVSAIIEQAGAKFAWITRIPGDIDGVSDAIAAFDAILSRGDAQTISLDKMSHVGWLFAWPLSLAGRAIQTSEKIKSVSNSQFVELINDRPIDLAPGWVTAAR